MIITVIVLFFTALVTTTVDALPITVQMAKYQGYCGAYNKSYFEVANLSSSSSPIVNTATSLSWATGFSIIQPGSSAYLYSPQFNSATSIPAGPLAIDVWASSTSALDGSNSSSFSAYSGSITLTTTQAYDIIYVTVAVSTTTVTVSTPTATGLTFTARGSVATSSATKISAFYAKTSTTPFSGTISVTLSLPIACVLTGFGISGTNTSNPFDPNVSTPITATGTNNAPLTTINALQKNDFVIGAAVISSAPTATAGSGFTIIANTVSSPILSVSEYKNWANSGSQQVSFSLSSTYVWAIIADAVVLNATATAALNMSAEIINSSGTIQTTLVDNQPAQVSFGDSQIVQVFQISACTVPAFGYVKIELKAPYSSPVKVFWGNVSSTNYMNSTNFQIAYTFNNI